MLLFQIKLHLLLPDGRTFKKFGSSCFLYLSGNSKMVILTSKVKMDVSTEKAAVNIPSQESNEAITINTTGGLKIDVGWKFGWAKILEKQVIDISYRLQDTPRT